MGTAILRSSVVGATLVLLGTPALASARDDVELCANAVDDDFDGTTDEEPCLAGSTVPVSGDGVIPELWYAGNLTCDDVGFGDLYGFKIDGTPEATSYPFVTNDFAIPPTILDGGPEDPYNHVTISNLVWYGDNIAQFDWASTLPIYAVLVKAQDASVYVYTPADYEDTALGTPTLDHQISHVEFCYNYALAIEKTAETAFHREYTWTIDKAADPFELDGFVGATVGTDYEVTVDRSFVDSGFTVTGAIDLYNPSLQAVGITVTDVLEGGYTAEVTCPDAIPSRESVTCTYEAAVPDAASRLNTATVVTDSLEAPGGTAQALAVFGTEPTTTGGYPTVNVTDTQSDSAAPWGPVSGDASWTYPATFDCPSDPALYVDGVYSFEAPNTATITETGQDATESVTVYCYAPVVTKDATPAYTRTYTWQIDKQVAPDAHVGFAGEAFVSQYDVIVDRTETDSGFAVQGTITVANPHPTEPMTVALSDSVGGVPATLDCGGTLVVPAAGSATCGYGASLADKADGTNTATATFAGLTFEGTAAWVFGEPTTVVGYPGVGVTDDKAGSLGSATGDATFTYVAYLACPTEASMYVGGTYPTSFDNTATITETGQSDSETLTLTCYAPIVTKDASTDFTRTYTWDIDKWASPAAHVGFVGNSFTSGYYVDVDQTVVDSDFRVFGTIAVQNPHPGAAMTVALSDAVDGVDATLDCGGSLVVPAGGTGTCGYSAYVGAPASGTNTATASLNGASFVGTASYAFGNETTDIVGFPVVTVTDSQPASFGELSVSGDIQLGYTAPFACSTDPPLYVEGIYGYQVDNVAKIEETGQSDSEQVTVTCYAPVVSKEAHAAWLRTYTWDIDKVADPIAHVGFPGDTFTSDYDVSVERIETASGFEVYGTITVTNPRPDASMSVALSDMVGDVAAALDCGQPLVVPAAGSATCGYSAALEGAVDGTNTATAVLDGVSFVGTAPWAFGEPTETVGFAEVDVTDDLQGALGHAAGTATFTYTVSFACPTEHSVYMPDGVYEEARPNTATIDQTGQWDDALVDLTCYDPADAKVIKTTQEGPEDIGQLPFAYDLRAPDGTVVETATLNGAGEVTFASGLEMEGTWTIEEIVPAGWVGIEPTTCTFEVDYRADAGTTYTCTFENVEKGRVDLVKYVNGVPADSEWTFALYLGPEGYGSEPVETVTVPYDSFTADLSPYAAFTLCELGLPAGWSATWSIDTDGDGYADTIVTPYNPDVGEDLGNRCFDFGTGTAFAVPIGATLVFEVDNTYTGEGGPRTPGYWKNWSTCSSGNQAETAARNGGPEEGFWLIDDVLPVTWDDILSDGFVYTIDTCEEAVAIFEMRDIDTDKSHAYDPAYKLARNLLAFQANQAAGACTVDAVSAYAVEAERLLDKYDFDGAGSYFRIKVSNNPKVSPYSADGMRALELAWILDEYNNGLYCLGAD